MKKILIAVENGPTAEKIASVGFSLGKQLNSEIALVSIVYIRPSTTGDGLTPKELADIEMVELKKTQKLLTEQVFKDYNIWTFIEEGKPSEMILKVAQEWQADLVVMGTHGRTGLNHFLMGSVAEKIIRHSTKPLLVIPTK